MYRISSLQKKLLLAALSLPVAAIAMAQDAANTAQKTVASSYNQLAILLVILYRGARLRYLGHGPGTG